MSDPNPSKPADQAYSPQVHWELSVKQTSRCCTAASWGSGAGALDELLLMFLNKVETDSWEDVKTFAAIAREYSTLTPREIAGLTGLTIDQVTSVPMPSEPPWTLSNPRTNGDIVFRTWTEYY